jgi:hypothetical protein
MSPTPSCSVIIPVQSVTQHVQLDGIIPIILSQDVQADVILAYLPRDVEDTEKLVRLAQSYEVQIAWGGPRPYDVFPWWDACNMGARQASSNWLVFIDIGAVLDQVDLCREIGGGRVSAATSGCLVVPRSRFLDVGGFWDGDEDIDLLHRLDTCLVPQDGVDMEVDGVWDGLLKKPVRSNGGCHPAEALHRVCVVTLCCRGWGPFVRATLSGVRDFLDCDLPVSVVCSSLDIDCDVALESMIQGWTLMVQEEENASQAWNSACQECHGTDADSYLFLDPAVLLDPGWSGEVVASLGTGVVLVARAVCGERFFGAWGDRLSGVCDDSGGGGDLRGFDEKIGHLGSGVDDLLVRVRWSGREVRAGDVLCYRNPRPSWVSGTEPGDWGDWYPDRTVNLGGYGLGGQVVIDRGTPKEGTFDAVRFHR